uniref:hypothetical protein n=1 Tax=Azorhizobium sp. AG788 TaxID=2183897 RepID=UPI003139677C
IAGVLGEHSVWVPPGVNGWFLIQWDEATVYSWFDFVDGAGNPFPVQPGELYQFSISTGNHRALQIYVDLVWLDAAGTVMGTSNSIGGTNASGATVIAFSGANGGASPEAPSGQRFEDARRLWVISTAPPGAVRVTPRVVKGPTKPGQGTSAMFGYRPYFGEAAPGQVLPSAWSDGLATAEIRAAVDALSASVSAAQTAALAGRLRVDAGQAFTDGQKAQGRQNLAAAAAGDVLRNRIINGAMRVSQEWASTPVSGGLGYAADQWESAASGSGFACTHAQVQGATPGGASHRLRITITAAKAALSGTDALVWTQALEGQQVADLQWGTGAARQALARFGFRGPAGTYSFSIRNGTPDRAYLAGFVIAPGQANLDTLQSFVIPGDLAGTWATGPTRGLMFSICLAASAAVTGGPGWQAGNLLAAPGQSNGLASTAHVFELFDAGLYVDIGNTGVLPVWQMPDPLDELRKSQRYYWKLDTPITASSLMVAGIYHGYQATLFHPVEMRVPPSVSANLTDYVNLYSWSITAGVRHAQVNLQADATANGMSLVVVNAGSLFNARM